MSAHLSRFQTEEAISRAIAHSIYPQTPGLGSNGEYRQERDGYNPERLAVYQHCDGADWMPAPENGRGIIHGRAVTLTPNTGYEPAEDSRQVPSPTDFPKTEQLAEIVPGCSQGDAAPKGLGCPEYKPLMRKPRAACLRGQADRVTAGDTFTGRVPFPQREPTNTGAVPPRPGFLA